MCWCSDLFWLTQEESLARDLIKLFYQGSLSGSIMANGKTKTVGDWRLEEGWEILSCGYDIATAAMFSHLPWVSQHLFMALGRNHGGILLPAVSEWETLTVTCLQCIVWKLWPNSHSHLKLTGFKIEQKDTNVGKAPVS